MASNRVTIKFLADVDGMHKGINQVNSQLSSFGSVATKMTSVLAGAFAVDKILDFGKASVLAASDLNEMSSKAEQVFGPAATSQMQEWAAGAAVSMGLSKTAALDAASTFGILGDKAGLTGTDLVDFSENFTKLAGDMASFSNTSVPDAIAAIGSGLRGEAEPLRRYGVLLDDATLKAEALKLGIYAGNGVLTSQQKILAAQSAIYAQTGKAQGDFARTSNGMANSMRQIQAASENATASIGEGLLVAINAVGKSLGGGEGIASGIESMGQSIGDVTAGLGVAVAAIAEWAAANSGSADETGDMTERLKDLTLQFGGPFTGAVYESILALEWLGDAGHKTMEEQKALNDSVKASEDLYAGYITTLDANKSAQDTATKAAYDGTAASESLTEALKAQDAAITKLTNRLDLKDFYAGLAKDIDKTSRSLSDNSQKGRDNQRVLIEGYGLVETAIKDYADTHVGQLDKINAYSDKKVRELRKNMIDQGFKPADVDRWLAVNTGWLPALANLTEKAAAAGGKIGKGLGDGMLAGMASKERAVAAQAARLTAIAEAAAREESQTHSPSKKWYLLGLDLVEGLSKGFSEGTLIFQNLVTDSTKAVSISAVSEISQIPEKMAEAYKGKLGSLQAVLDTQGAIIQQGLDAIKSMSDGFVQDIVGNISFKTEDAQGNALTPEQMMQAMGFDIQRQKDAVAAIAQNIGTTLPPALLSQILAMPPDTAIQLANYLGANPEMLSTLVTNYQGLADYTEIALGQPMALAWAKVGDQSAVAAIEAAKKKIDAEAEDFKKWVRSKLNTKIYIDVEYREVNKPSNVVSQINAYENLNGTTWRVS